MTNNTLFNTNTIRVKCSGCGKLFDIAELKQCSACKELFCAECQKTHDCTAESASPKPSTPVPSAHAPSVHIPSAHTPSVHVPLASAPSAAAPSKTFLLAPQNREKDDPAPMSEDEAYSAYVRSLNPFVECEECGESYPQSDMWKCPDCGMVLCQICREKHRCPRPEPEKKSILGFIPFFAGKKTAQTGLQPQEKADGKKGTEVKEEEEEQIVCDGCGKSFPKSKMKRCRNCGAVLCPICRMRHFCAGPGDKKEKDKDKWKDKQKEKSPETKESAPQSTDTKGKKEEEEQIVCDGCGNSFPKSKMRKCRECGDVLCPKCQKKHVCREKTGDTRTKEQE